MENPKLATQGLAPTGGDPDGWFEAFYARAGGDISKILGDTGSSGHCDAEWPMPPIETPGAEKA